MSFQLRVNGQVVWKSERQVTRVALQSGRGESGFIGISNEGVVDVVVSETPVGGPMLLDHVEAAAIKAYRDSIPEGADSVSNTSDRYVPSEDANKGIQDFHSYLTDPDSIPEEGAPTVNLSVEEDDAEG